MNAPWPLDPLGDVRDQTRFVVWEFEGAKQGHRPVDDPRDAGGRTLSGLTRRTYSNYLHLPDGQLAPVRQFDDLSLDDVVSIISELFAMRTGLWRIVDPALRFALLDFAIHAGADDAVPALQRAVDIVPDGQLGPATLAAVAAYPNPHGLIAIVMDARYQKAGRAVVKRPASLAFLNGWLVRFGRVLRITAGEAP